MSYGLRGGKGKHSGYPGGPWPNEHRGQPGQEPKERRGQAILLATWMEVGWVARAPRRKLNLEMGLLNHYEDAKGGAAGRDEAERPETGLHLETP